MRNCPFCNKEVDEKAYVYGVHYNEKISKYLFDHVCHLAEGIDVSITVYGLTEDEVIDRWNGVQNEEHLTD